MEVGGESAAAATGLFLLLTVLKKKCLVKSEIQVDYSSLVCYVIVTHLSYVCGFTDH